MLEKKNCFNCNNARPVEIQCTTCICKAGKGTKILDNYTGRIWIVENENTHQLCDEIAEKYDVKKLEEKQFINKYKDYRYTFELIEK